MVGVDHLLALFSIEASEGEHSDLRGDVVPVAGGSILDEVVLEENTHLDDAVSHPLAFVKPEESVGDVGVVNTK